MIDEFAELEIEDVIASKSTHRLVVGEVSPWKCCSPIDVRIELIVHSVRSTSSRVRFYGL